MSNRPIFTAKIDVTEIVKAYLFHSQKPKKNGGLPVYLDLAFFEKAGEFSDGYIVQSAPKEARDKGERGPIVGNYKLRSASDNSPNEPKKQAMTPSNAAASDDIPF